MQIIPQRRQQFTVTGMALDDCHRLTKLYLFLFYKRMIAMPREMGCELYVQWEKIQFFPELGVYLKVKLKLKWESILPLK